MTEVEEIEKGDCEAGIRGQAWNLHDYFRSGSPDDFRKFLEALLKVEGGTISRTEAAQLLGCSRQRIHQIVRSGEVECWQFHGGYLLPTMMYSELSVLDLLAYARRIGRPVTKDQVMKHATWCDSLKAYYKRQGTT